MISKKPGFPGFFASRLSFGNFLIDPNHQHERARELLRLRDRHGGPSPNVSPTANKQCGLGRMKNKKAPEPRGLSFSTTASRQKLTLGTAPPLTALTLCAAAGRAQIGPGVANDRPRRLEEKAGHGESDDQIRPR